MDAGFRNLGSDILSTLDGMRNARYVAAAMAHAVADHQGRISPRELFDYEEQFAKEYALNSQRNRSEYVVKQVPPLPTGSTDSAK